MGVWGFEFGAFTVGRSRACALEGLLCLGDEQGKSLYRRDFPLLKQSTGLFLEIRRSRLSHSPYAERPSVGISRSAERDDWGFSPPSTPSAKLARLATAFLDRRLSFVRKRNKVGSWRSQLLGNSAKPTFHASLHPALFNF